jgi:hypothetical protein
MQETLARCLAVLRAFAVPAAQTQLHVERGQRNPVQNVSNIAQSEHWQNQLASFCTSGQGLRRRIGFRI